MAILASDRPLQPTSFAVEADGRARVLVLGGTPEARRLADTLAPWDGVEVVTSQAGEFAAADELAAYIGELRPTAVVDATNAYAETLSRYARRACAALSVPRVRLARPGWPPKAGDDWRFADDLAEALTLAAKIGRRVFLSVGRLDTALLAPFPKHWFLVRCAEPVADMPDNVRAIRSRGPFRRDTEVELLEGHRIDVLVGMLAGGGSAYAKIEAARELGLPVVMLRRPDPPSGPLVTSVGGAMAWLDQLMETRRFDRAS
jgi:precorrin-6A/cobalt-precorrin-6A reductase